MATFKKLWDGHPSVNKEHEPCKSKKKQTLVENQCAIRLGIALRNAGISIDGSVRQCFEIFGKDDAKEFLEKKGKKVTNDEVKALLEDAKSLEDHKHSQHIVRAPELAKWLEDKGGWKKVGCERRILIAADSGEKSPAVGRQKKIEGKQGIVFMDNFPRESDGKPRSDHIDLWDGKQPDGKKLARQIAKTTDVNRFFNAREVWFWEMKPTTSKKP